MAKPKAKYEYCKIDVPKYVLDRSENAMYLIGCNTRSTFVSMALIEYCKKIEQENVQAVSQEDKQ